jgi:hypothetical protein
MKSSLMRPALALTLVLGLSACGGKASFPIGVTVTGLQYPGLVLTTNGMDLAINPPATPGAAVTATFPNSIAYGEVFAVVPKTQPPHQTCGPISAVDRSWTNTAGLLAVINAQLTCSLVANGVGGPITGLTADGLVLTNGSTGGTLTIAKDANSFAFASVQYGTTYGITVLTQPTGLVCTVGQNGSGTMGDTAVTDIAITCAATAPTP